MKKVALVFIFMFVKMNISFCQSIKIDNGIVISSFNNNKNLPFLRSSIPAYNVNLGIDYLEKSWYGLSSQLGYAQYGGKQSDDLLPDEYKNTKENRGFIHANTTFRAFLKKSKVEYFLGIGPYLNVLAGDRNFDSPLYKPNYVYNNINWGTKSEIGLNYTIDMFKIGLNGSYNYNVSPVATSGAIDLKNNSFAASLSVGYKLR